MNVLVKLTVPNTIYRFYSDASRHVANRTPEELMADALLAYAELISGSAQDAPEDPPSA